MFKTILVVSVCLLLLMTVTAQATEWSKSSCQASSALWSASNGIDGNSGTCWSSRLRNGPSYTEWYAFWFDGFHDVNYIRMTPRFSTTALGFPKTFTIYWYNGSTWTAIRTVTNMQTPYRNDDIILAFPSTVNCSGIKVTATTLGGDDVGNYVFQMAEFNAGYDATFSQFVWIGNNGASNKAEIRQVGSGPFDPNKISNWNYDARNPIIVPNSGTYRNIYAPSVVYNGAWNVYFGGWDGTSYGNDELSVTVTYDSFGTFGTHNKLVTHGAFQHVCNDSVLKVGTNDWRMAYTTYNGYTNKPGYATSTNGVNWTPSSGNTSYLMTMSGYPDWSNADVNGGNHIYYENGTYHMYFTDFQNMGVHYATSTNNVNYTYQGMMLSDSVVCNDLKSWDYDGTRYYLWGYHANGDSLYYSLGTDVTAPPAIETLFTNNGSADRYITSVGFVSDGSRLWGALYGAGAVSSFDQNRIFAKWLQRKVMFSNAYTALGIGEQSYGPNTLYLYMVTNQKVETGSFDIYDTDGSTILQQTSNVTLLSGDIWQCAF